MFSKVQSKKSGNRKKNIKAFFSKPYANSLFIMLAAAFFIGAMLCLAITPEKHDLKVGQIAPKTITATKEVVDEVTTQKNRDIAAKNVEPSYHQIEDVKESVMEEFESLFRQIFAIQAYGENLRENMDEKAGFVQEEIDYAQSMLPDIPLTDYQTSTLLNSNKEKLELAYNETSTTLLASYNGAIRGDKINESIQNMQRLIGVKVDTGLLLNVITPLLRQIVQPNFVIDEDGTAQVKEKAMEAVEPVVYTQGQNIVVAGERVEHNQFEMLRSLGLLTNKKIDVSNYIGVILLTIIIMMTGVLLLRLLKPSILRKPKNSLVFSLVLVLTIGVTILGARFNKNLILIYMGGLLLSALLGTRAGVIGNMMLALFVSVVPGVGTNSFSSDMVRIAIVSIIGGTLAVYMLKSKPQRVWVLLGGFCGALSNIIAVLAIGLITNNDIRVVGTSGLLYALGAIFASVLVLAIQPLFEVVFNLATQSKLSELANPKQPLLRRLLLEAPGTYYHSIVVANLAEAAADAIGANGVLARAGAYFHDVGKLKRPAYFKENQLGDNPHDNMDPYMSAAIIMAHTRDGYSLTKQYRLPEEVQKITLEHHGDTYVGYFYHKAKEEAEEGTVVDINDFRYDGARPTTKESAIIMLADTVEAAVRSMKEPTAENINRFIAELVKGKIADGQLSDAPLTLRDIDKICAAFLLVLGGVYHERIEYPVEAVGIRKERRAPEVKKEGDPGDQPENKNAPAEKPEKEEKETGELEAIAQERKMAEEKPESAEEKPEVTEKPLEKTEEEPPAKGQENNEVEQQRQEIAGEEANEN